MSEITIDSALIGRLAARNNFLVPDDDLLFFGIRGALPVDISGTPFAADHKLRLTDFNHVQMRCTLGQVRVDDDMLAVFPGSTVPSRPNVEAARRNGGTGANMLMPGKYRYERGIHKLGRPSGHRAFRQAEFFPVWRNSDDMDFDLSDRPDLDGDLVWDNLHCAYHDNLDTPGFSSAGCQVICGQPRSAARGNRPETGPWKRFIDNSYGAAGGQNRYTYLLFSGAEAAMVAGKPDSEIMQSVRFGSSGDLVKTVQTALVAKGYELGTADGGFGRNTIEAVMAFQRREFGPGQADGIVGVNTAEALGITLPRLSGAGAGAGPAPLDARISIDEVENLTPAVSGPYPIVVTQSGRDWSATVDGGASFYVGTSVGWGGHKGIYQPVGQLPLVPGGEYKPAAWASALGGNGPWAWFLQPTILGESGGFLCRVNTYDGAGLTWGPLQLASHTANDNLILLFRRLMALPGAERWFPDLTLVGGKLHRRVATGPVSLETQGVNGRITAFMEYLNPDHASVSKIEVENTARLTAWTVADNAVVQAQVELAIERFGKRVNRLSTHYGVDLTRQPLERLIWVADILHHGRGTYAQIKSAILSATPDSTLAGIGAGDPRWADRIATVKAEIARVKPRLAGEQWGRGAFAL
jgi:peptidoglycan hydrolase-like protein with peptidoglycan-binding domain